MRRRAVGGLWKGDFSSSRSLRPICREAPKTKTRQAVFAFAGNEEASKQVDVFEHHIVAMCDAFHPVFTSRRIYRRSYEAEVAAAIVGANEPKAVAVVDGILVLVFTGANELELAEGIVGGEDPGFGCDVTCGFEDEKFAVASAAGANVEALVVVLVDEFVLRVGGAAGVTPELELALLFLVLNGVEECLIIGGPDD